MSFSRSIIAKQTSVQVSSIKAYSSQTLVLGYIKPSLRHCHTTTQKAGLLVVCQVQVLIANEVGLQEDGPSTRKSYPVKRLQCYKGKSIKTEIGVRTRKCAVHSAQQSKEEQHRSADHMHVCSPLLPLVSCIHTAPPICPLHPSNVATHRRDDWLSLLDESHFDFRSVPRDYCMHSIHE